RGCGNLLSAGLPPAGEGNAGALPLSDGSVPARVGLRLTGIARFGVRDVRIGATCNGELFVETIAKDAYVYAQQGKRKTLQRKDLDNAIEAIDEFAFLEGEFLLGFTWLQYFV
uniref:Transcription factor CBF/NF-Y/archaeal histone domain-containing protein n=1 Tax=Buteo japonicus TaxID=224669 RepID=A0A8C0BVC5_9AVES